MWVKSGETVSEMSSKLSPISILGRVEFAFFLHPAAALTILFRCAKLCAKCKWNCVQKEYYFVFNFMYFCVHLCSLLQAATYPNPLSAQCPASWFCSCAKVVCKHCVQTLCAQNVFNCANSYSIVCKIVFTCGGSQPYPLILSRHNVRGMSSQGDWRGPDPLHADTKRINFQIFNFFLFFSSQCFQLCQLRQELLQ